MTKQRQVFHPQVNIQNVVSLVLVLTCYFHCKTYLPLCDTVKSISSCGMTLPTTTTHFASTNHTTTLRISLILRATYYY